MNKRIIILGLIVFIQSFKMVNAQSGKKLELDSSFVKKINQNDFGFIKKIKLDSNENLYVHDYFSGIFLFDQDGILLKNYNSKGRGPGDYQDISDMIVLKSGNILILDSELYRATILSKGNFEYLKSFNLSLMSTEKGYRMIPNRVWNITEKESSFFIIEYLESYHRNSKDDIRLKKYITVDNEFETVNMNFMEVKGDEILIVEEGGNFLATVMPFGRKSLIDFDSDGESYYAWSDAPCFSININKKSGQASQRCIEGKARKIAIPEQLLKEVYNSENGEIYRKAKIKENFPSLEDLIVVKEALWLMKRLNEKDIELIKVSFDGKIIDDFYLENNSFKLLEIKNENLYGINYPTFGYEVPKIFKYEIIK